MTGVGGGPLSVIVDDGIIERDVTRYTTGLSFRKTAQGGHQGLSCKIDLPTGTFTDLDVTGRIRVCDNRNARRVWDGYTQNPGDTQGPAGQSLDMSAVGGMALMSDEHRAMMYVDQALDGWSRINGLSQMPASAVTEGSTVDPTIGTDAGGAPNGILMQFPPGSPIGPGMVAEIGYRFAGTDMELGGLSAIVKSGKLADGFRNWIGTSDATTAYDTPIVSTSLISTTPTPVEFYPGPTSGVPGGITTVAFYLQRTGEPTNVADDLAWTFAYNVSVIGRRVDQLGHLLTGPNGLGSTTYVLSHQVVLDLFGRLMSFCDPATSIIDTTTTTPIDQLTYRDPVAADSILNDLILYEPDLLWEVLESRPGRGHRFHYRRWPTVHRYEISVRDGYVTTGSDVDLCNRIAVHWIDAAGVAQTMIRTSLVPALGSRVRDADPVTLPEGRGSAAAAARIGDTILASKTSAGISARATIRRPIMDRMTGTAVMPWEIEPGYLLRVRELGIDLRLTEMEYTHDDRAAALALGTPSYTNEQRLAQLSRTA